MLCYCVCILNSTFSVTFSSPRYCFSYTPKNTLTGKVKYIHKTDVFGKHLLKLFGKSAFHCIPLWAMSFEIIANLMIKLTLHWCNCLLVCTRPLISKGHNPQWNWYCTLNSSGTSGKFSLASQARMLENIFSLLVWMRCYLKVTKPCFHNTKKSKENNISSR